MPTLKYILMILSICLLTNAKAYPQINNRNPNEIIIREGQAQLFLDDELIAEKQNINKVWHRLQKHPSNPLIISSEPEKFGLIYGTVLREQDPANPDEFIFRMWYYAIKDAGAIWIAYAESRDGLSWEKPSLGLIEIDSTKDNNAVVKPGDGWILLGLSGVIKDSSAGIPESERYKMIAPAKRYINNVKYKEFLFLVSPDGIHWTLQKTWMIERPPKPDRACFVWDSFRQVYALYLRDYHKPPDLVERGGPDYDGRAVALSTSPDFKNWSTPEMVMHADSVDADGVNIYGLSAFPYEGQWVGLPQIHYSLPEQAYVDIAIAHSRDGIQWQRELETVIPLGDVGEWDRFRLTASTRPVRVGDELWVYFSGRNYRHGEYSNYTDLTDSGPAFAGIGLATIRLDGWCSLQASFDGGQIITKTIILPKGELYLNTKSDWGEILVEVLDSTGTKIENMQSLPVSANGIRVQVEWPEGVVFENLAGQPVKIKFTIKNAHLYAWVVGSNIETKVEAIKSGNRDVPVDFELSHNYPNPFNSSTMFNFMVKKSAKVKVDVYDILGNHIKNLLENDVYSGPQRVVWDGTNENNNPVSSGIYFCRFNVGRYSVSHKMIFSK